jgi:hypothetical protein
VNDSAPDIAEYPLESVTITVIEAAVSTALGAQTTVAVAPEQPAGSPYQT